MVGNTFSDVYCACHYQKVALHYMKVTPSVCDSERVTDNTVASVLKLG